MITSDGIERVRASVLASGIGSDGSNVAEPLVVLVSWRSEHSDKLHQVYVDGELGGVTNDCLERGIVVGIRLGEFGASEIEVLAVDGDECGVDHSGQLGLAGRRNRVKISWARGMSLPFGGRAEVYSDSGSGVVDYGVSVTKRAIGLFAGWQDSCGFGLSGFGNSDFGFDGSAAVGFGRGDFGRGEFGFDADMIEWESGKKQTGVYKFGVKVIDEHGNYSGGVESEDVIVIETSEPAVKLAVDSYDNGTNHLVLSVS